MTRADHWKTGAHLMNCHSHRCDKCLQLWGCDGQDCKGLYGKICPDCADPLTVRLDDGRRVKLTHATEIYMDLNMKATLWRGSKRLGTVSRRDDRNKLVAWIREETPEIAS